MSHMVSVVIPCYNQAQFLQGAVDSVRTQTYPHVEIVVVNDGSTDETAAVAAANPGVRYVEQTNRGLSAARNVGWRASRGDYLVFLDADDLLLPSAIELGMRTIAEHPECAFVSGQHRRLTNDGRARVVGPWVVASDHYLALLSGNYIGMHATVLYQRGALEESGGFDEDLRAVEDYDLYLRIARHHPICCHSDVVADYRLHGGNMSRDIGMMFTSVHAVLRRQEPFIKSDARRERAYQRGVRSFWLYYADELLHQDKHALLDRHGRERAGKAIRALASNLPPHSAQDGLRATARRLRRGLNWVRRRATRPGVGRVRFGDLRRLRPISDEFGFDRGMPIDRAYIEAFLDRHRADIRGRVLEIGDNAYTLRYGAERVTQSDVLHVAAGNPQATFVGDLAGDNDLPADAFDCVVLTQTLHLIFDMPASVRTLHRILRPGGVLLVTVPGITSIARDEWGNDWFWSLTTMSTRRLFEEVFPAQAVAVAAHGNVLSAIAFLHGLAASELRPSELDASDPAYEVLITTRAVKEGGGQ